MLLLMSDQLSVFHTNYLKDLLRLPGPSFEDGRDELRQLGGYSVRSLRELLAENFLGASITSSWNNDRCSIETFFGCATAGHSLSSQPYGWLHPLERQVTEGIAHFLNEGAARQRRGRTLSFLRALDPPAGRSWPNELTHSLVIAEEVASGDDLSDGRIDLLVSASDSEGKRVGAVIEAKLEAKLGGNPLATYEHQAKSFGLSVRNSSFLVIGTRTDATVRNQLARAPAWRFQSWRRLLLGLDRELPPEFDDDEFKRFRSTLFRRCL
jgi:hypothetical protein